MTRKAAFEPPTRGETQLTVVTISEELTRRLKAQVDDLVYVSDARWWLGGLRSVHAVVGSIDGKLDGKVVRMGSETFAAVVSSRRRLKPVVVERLY